MRGIAALAALSLAFAAAASTAIGAEPPIQSMSSPKVGGPFVLRDTNGQRFASDKLAGKPFVLFFGYTYCPDICPMTLVHLARLRTALGAQGDKFAIVFVTVDPARDTPAALRKYVTAFDTPIIGLTGSQPEIDRVVHAFHASVRRIPQKGGPDLIAHTGTPYLMGKRGEYRALLSGNNAADLALLRAAIQSP